MFKKKLVRLLLRAMDYLVEAIPENAYQFVRRGCVRANLGEFQDAVADFSTAIELNPTYGDAYRLRAVAFLGMQQSERAMEDIQEDLRLRPENAATRATYGDVLREMQQHAEAYREYERALELDPQCFSAFIGRAHCHYDDGDWRNAIADFRRGISLGSKNEDVRVYLGKADEHLRNATRKP